MDIAVTPISPGDPVATRRTYEILADAARVDVPDLPRMPWEIFLAQLAHPWPGERREQALATVDGEPVGCLDLELPELENTDNAGVQITVHPDHRRRGAGRALHAYAVERVRALGRKRLMGHGPDHLPGGPPGSSPGARFAAAVGAKPALSEVRRRLDLSTVDEAALTTMLADAWDRATGFRLVRWGDATPEEVLPDVAYLDGRLLQDAPMGDLAMEPEKVDSERVRKGEAARLARGRRSFHTGVRHNGTGRLVAFTGLSLTTGIDWHAWQQITIVDPDHRGHRLGTVVKIENLRYARREQPGLRAIDTFNAAANDHMIAINEAMGFRPVDTWDNWQQDL